MDEVPGVELSSRDMAEYLRFPILADEGPGLGRCTAIYVLPALLASPLNSSYPSSPHEGAVEGGAEGTEEGGAEGAEEGTDHMVEGAVEGVGRERTLCQEWPPSALLPTGMMASTLS